MHTNIFAQGIGNREQQFYLWFDPTLDFHTYSVLWTPNQITFSVDRIHVHFLKTGRQSWVKQIEIIIIPRAKQCGCTLAFEIWNADDWVTSGGLVKTDWSKTPFVASFSNFNVATSSNFTGEQALDLNKEKKLQWAQKNYMIYDYCADTNRFPQGLPVECK